MECFHVFNVSPALLNENYSATDQCACKENYLIKNLKSALYLKMQEEMLNKHKLVLSKVFSYNSLSGFFPVHSQHI